jgi:hypothetical protein
MKKDKMTGDRALKVLETQLGILHDSASDALEDAQSSGDWDREERERAILDTHELVFQTLNDVKKLKRFINNTPAEEYPLHLNHEIPLIKDEVKKALEKGT